MLRSVSAIAIAASIVWAAPVKAENTPAPHGPAIILAQFGPAETLSATIEQSIRWNRHAPGEKKPVTTKGPHADPSPSPSLLYEAPPQPSAPHPISTTSEQMWNSAEDIKYVDFFKAHR
ncbi:MAG: hypothetical protein AAGD92_09945 [Pseudomonadota bacterium]